MINPELSKYIAQLRASNISEEIIKDQLVKSGWPESDVAEALSPQIINSTNMLPPPPIPRFSMWISFQYVLLFITLWIWSIALGGIWNFMVDKNIPDPVTSGNSYNFRSSMSETLLPGYSAAIIVAFPFFVWLYLALNHAVIKNPGIRNIKTRKFLMYFTVIVNFIYMIVQLIATVYSFLNASISTTTIPHLLVNLSIPGLVCLYILSSVREDRKN